MMMLTTPRDPENAKRVATARSYKRQGYRVTIPTRGDPLPAFLDGLAPDLIAERTDDHVVIEIKRADRVAGSNDLVALSERVERQPGWRLEFISVPAPVEIELWGEATRASADHLIKHGAFKAAFLLTFAELENALTWLSVKEDLRIDFNFASTASQLAAQGIISSELLTQVLGAVKIRNSLVHNGASRSPTPSELLALSELCERLRREVRDEAQA